MKDVATVQNTHARQPVLGAPPAAHHAQQASISRHDSSAPPAAAHTPGEAHGERAVMVRILLRRGRERDTMERTVALKDVEAVAETEGGLVCRVAGRDVEIRLLLIQPGSEVWACGDRGTVLVPLWLASELGVAPGDPTSAPPAVPIRPR